MRDKPALLMSDGKLVWPLYSILTTECDLDFVGYPYDCQHCSIQFLAFSPDVTLKVSSLKVADNFTDDSSLWCIPSLCPSDHIAQSHQSIEITILKVNSSNVFGRNLSNSLVQIDITLCRILSFYLWGIFIPYTIVSILIPITFIIPPSRVEHEEEIKQNEVSKTTILVVSYNYNERLTFSITLFLTFVLFHSTVIADLPKVSGIVWLVKSLSLRMVISGISIMYIICQSLARKIYPKLRINSIIKGIYSLVVRKNVREGNEVKPAAENSASDHDQYETINAGDEEKGRQVNSNGKRLNKKGEQTKTVKSETSNGAKLTKTSNIATKKKEDMPSESNPVEETSHQGNKKKNSLSKKNCTNLFRNLSIYFLLDIFSLVGSTTWLFLLSANGYELDGKPTVYEKNLPAEDSLTSIFKQMDLI